MRHRDSLCFDTRLCLCVCVCVFMCVHVRVCCYYSHLIVSSCFSLKLLKMLKNTQNKMDRKEPNN